MRVVYYSLAAVATVLACLLWVFVLRQVAGSSAAPPATVAAGVLPVVPKIELADETRLVCLGGYVARVGEGQLVTVTVEGQPVPCK